MPRPWLSARPPLTSAPEQEPSGGIDRDVRRTPEPGSFSAALVTLHDPPVRPRRPLMPLHSNPFQQHACRLVTRVLWHQLASERF
jgi:hypothetical protein